MTETAHVPETVSAFLEPACADSACGHSEPSDPCPTEERQVCAECSTPDTGDYGTCDVVFSAPWPCKPSRRERLRVVPSS